MAGRIGLGWVMTLPASAIMGAFAAGLALLGPIGIVLDMVIGTIVIMALFRWSRRNRVTHHTLLNDIDDAGRVVHIKKTPRRPTRRDRRNVSL